MKVISIDFRMLVCPCETEYPPGTQLNIFGKLKFDMAGEWEVVVVIMKKKQKDCLSAEPSTMAISLLSTKATERSSRS